PSALTDDEKATLAEMERGLVFDEKRHELEMRGRERSAEAVLSEVSTDFRIELMRQDKERELFRNRPLALQPANANANEVNEANEQSELPARTVRPSTNTANANTPIETSEQFAQTTADTLLADPANDEANEANTAGQDAPTGNPFGFSAALPNSTPTPKATANRSPRHANTAKANPAPKANANAANTNTNTVREDAANAYLKSLKTGEPLTGAELGRRYGRTARWGQKLITDLKPEAGQ
ncbi:hypothetical protein, partial [Streptomyces sp. NEAU-H3]|uniref:hypothetical protein n=1 Tax=Streptomyces sp. NEAU-H3 TaxID=2720636 RepID=UPI0016B64180